MRFRVLDWPAAAVCLLASLLVSSSPGLGDPAVFTPGFWDPHARPIKPDLASLHSLRFLTEDDYPPFHFAAADGTLAGFDIDLTRAICEDLKLSCTIQARRFDTLVDSLKADQGDAIIASIRMDEKSRGELDFTAPYSKNPARFVTLKSTALTDATPETLRAKYIGVLAKTAHQAFLSAFFKSSVQRPFETQKALTEALNKGEVDAIFGDGIALSFWLQGQDAHNCCAFLGGPFLDSRFFGDGVGIAVKKDNPLLRQALDYALADLSAKGVYTDLYLKYFPLGFY
ncbi:transporter substrate-binding domain-containing protein [Methylocella tundrae]|uniref:transporter substrate-binding domain-containing protein n=1 Tax=Methylocella tundrae TaxID=227605 RepID=UPI00106ACB67|nr:transporter substrate-binding domain-containing protein [Methylocella tundrae]WPP04000.1 transporter substrate-binding domain-containing protein [Methylocella tundrae]